CATSGWSLMDHW
nr:immunoglobulin heavy chain junction region [Macaca mulatta]MOY30582.1 immunoglobulin heavy chain junction region [Macaca mulatta]